MKNRDLAGIIVASVICGVVYSAYLVRTQSNVCPKPSASSITSLLAPCQAFDTAIGHTVSKQEAVHMGLLRPDESNTPGAPRLAASPENERATVGVATTRRR
jgi:hypothetical protein